jgi:nitrite reductase/ring-hydroxylating ferredoxin subunit
MLTLPFKFFQMKKIVYLILTLTVIFSCSDDEELRRNNPNLLDVNVNFTVHTNLPQFNSLNFPSDPVYVGNQGNGGIFLMNTGSGYVAWDAIDPNHARNENCTSMQLNGLRLVCECEENTYDLFTGNFIEGENLQYTLYNYRINKIGEGELQVSNK